MSFSHNCIVEYCRSISPPLFKSLSLEESTLPSASSHPMHLEQLGWGHIAIVVAIGAVTLFNILGIILFRDRGTYA